MINIQNEFFSDKLCANFSGTNALWDVSWTIFVLPIRMSNASDALSKKSGISSNYFNDKWKLCFTYFVTLLIYFGKTIICWNLYTKLWWLNLKLYFPLLATPASNYFSYSLIFYIRYIREKNFTNIFVKLDEEFLEWLPIKMVIKKYSAKTEIFISKKL
jgi:hypothetical protein